MKCINCIFLSKTKILGSKDEFPSVRCTLGLWDSDNTPGVPQYYAYGSAVRNRDPVKRHGENCTHGKPN